MARQNKIVQKSILYLGVTDRLKLGAWSRITYVALYSSVSYPIIEEKLIYKVPSVDAVCRIDFEIEHHRMEH